MDIILLLLMKLKVIYTKHFPVKGFTALTIWPFVFVRKDRIDHFTPSAATHEEIHAAQQIEMLWILFLILYALEWVIKIPFRKFDTERAYMSISFEQEAFLYMDDPHYLDNRKPFAWRKFIFTKKH